MPPYGAMLVTYGPRRNCPDIPLLRNPPPPPKIGVGTAFFPPSPFSGILGGLNLFLARSVSVLPPPGHRPPNYPSSSFFPGDIARDSAQYKLGHRRRIGVQLAAQKPGGPPNSIPRSFLGQKIK